MILRDDFSFFHITAYVICLSKLTATTYSVRKIEGNVLYWVSNSRLLKILAFSFQTNLVVIVYKKKKRHVRFKHFPVSLIPPELTLLIYKS